MLDAMVFKMASIPNSDSRCFIKHGFAVVHTIFENMSVTNRKISRPGIFNNLKILYLSSLFNRIVQEDVKSEKNQPLRLARYDDIILLIFNASGYFIWVVSAGVGIF